MTLQPGCDAVLLLAFGGPERMQDVRPFLDNVLRARPTTPQRYEEVVHHYERVGGRSPLRELTQRQADALTAELAARGRPLPVHIGMRHWNPYIGETLKALTDAGARRVIAPILSAFDSPASAQAYEAAVAQQLALLGEHAPTVRCIGGLGTRPGFVEANAERVREALDALGAAAADARVVFTAHSIPEAAARRSPYVEQYRACAQLVARACGEPSWTLAYQSRSGTPLTPWLGPDVLEVLRDHAATTTSPVVLAPIGFVCDHVEVLYDLDIEAVELAQRLGIRLRRAQAASDHPAFIRAIADAVEEADAS